MAIRGVETPADRTAAIVDRIGITQEDQIVTVWNTTIHVDVLQKQTIAAVYRKWILVVMGWKQIAAMII